MSREERELDRAATKLLRAKGFTAAGRPKKDVNRKQAEFESGIINTPMGGKPR
jgi:hypothetical protein